MKITGIEITESFKANCQKRLRAVLCVTFDNELLIKDIKLLQKRDGSYCVAFPRTDEAKKHFTENIIPLNSKVRENITKAVVNYYLNSRRLC